MDEIRKALLGARAERHANLTKGFDAEPLQSDENPFVKAAEETEDDEEDVEKARTSAGTYADTAENRKLGRVGQRYHTASDREADSDENLRKRGITPNKEKYNDGSAKKVSSYRGIGQHYRMNQKEDGTINLQVKTGGDQPYRIKKKGDGYVLQQAYGGSNFQSVSWGKIKETASVEAALDAVIARHNRADSYMNWGKIGGDLKKADDTDLEKSDVMRAFSDGGGLLMIKKSGKEVKAQITDVVLPKFTAALEEAKGKADGYLEQCGAGPTKNVEPWWTNDLRIDVPYKVYGWDETCCPVEKVDSAPGYGYVEAANQPIGPAPTKNCAANAEQAAARENYNQAVRKVCEIMVDLKAVNIMKDNLKDDQQLELNPRQAATLCFE